LQAEPFFPLIVSKSACRDDVAFAEKVPAGAGWGLIIGVDWSSFGDVADPLVWSQIHDEGSQVLENIANIRVPVIAAIEGRAHIVREVGYGLSLEGASSAALMKSKQAKSEGAAGKRKSA
jgi:enoyl-CoA hydratase/carnithine racemase